jgi:hypothetical protein
MERGSRLVNGGWWLVVGTSEYFVYLGFKGRQPGKSSTTKSMAALRNSWMGFTTDDTNGHG